MAQPSVTALQDATASESPVALDDRIAWLEGELAGLHQRRRARDHAAILLAILQVTDTWFRTHELLDAMLVSPPLSQWFAGKSAKSAGKLLRAIADAQDQSSTVPALRLVRLDRTNGGALWRVETHLPSGATNRAG